VTTKPVIKYENGQLYWHDLVGDRWFWKSRDDADRLLREFRREVREHKWFAPRALEIAHEIEAAIAAYDADEDDNHQQQWEVETGRGSAG
jgi:hypothetical protein